MPTYDRNHRRPQDAEPGGPKQFKLALSELCHRGAIKIGAMEQLVERVATWASSAGDAALGADLVPGATKTERSALAALGGLARALAPDSIQSWPTAVALWAEKGVSPAPDLVDEVARQLASGVDVLAAVYERVVAGRSRRRLGTFFTPPLVVEFLLDRAEALGGKPKFVIDPGAGVGAFTVAARRRWPDAQVIAVDVNVVTLGLLAARCAHEEIKSIDLLHCDYLEWIADRHRGGNRTLIVGNPPYTRHQEIPAKLKKEARERCSQLIDSGLAGLSAYFLAQSVLSLGASDTLSFLLPGSWTEARYGREIRKSLWTSSKRRIEFFPFPPTTSVFPGTQVSAVVLTVGPEKRTPQPITAARLDLRPDRLSTGATRTRTRRTTPPDDFGQWLWPRARASVKDYMLLGDVARVRRGTATGANNFFFLTDDERNDLPVGATRRAILRMGQIDGEELTIASHNELGRRGEQRWLLWLHDLEVAKDKAVRAKLKRGKKDALHLRHLTSLRDPWYAVEKVDTPELLFGPMARGDFRVVVNTAKAIPSNSLYGIYLPDFESKSILSIARWINGKNGQQMIRSEARHYSGLMKLDPKRVLDIRLPKELFD